MFLKRIFIANIFLFALSFMALSQAQPSFNYEASWKKVDELINKKGLPESALKEVKAIYAAAKKEKNNAQLIKALVFQLNIQQQKEEDATVKGILEIEKEINTSAEPVKSILSNLLAEAYWQYLQNNRWKFYDRTNTKAFAKDDLETWTIDDFHHKISSLYLSSVKEEKLLQQTRLENFEPILNKGNKRYLRPTLYDLLVHRAIDYFENDERSLTKPADAFEINSAAAFSPAADFIKQKFTTSDSLSLHHKALLLYQRVLAFHLNDNKPDALIDADLQRIEFVNLYSTNENKLELYRTALNHLINQ